MKNLLARFITYLTEQVDTAPTWRSLLLRATLIHAPFLLLYVTVALVSIRPQDVRTHCDSGDYLKYAEAIVQSVSTGTNHITSLWFGPGYPLLLAPTIALGIGIIPAMLISPVLLYGAIVLFFLTVRQFLSTRTSLFVSAIHALYYPYLRSIQGLWSDPLAVFLICAICCISPLVFLNPKEKLDRKYTVIGAFLLGYLSLTKPLFGYVFTALILASVIGLVFTRSPFWRKSGRVCLGAAVVTLPYLGWSCILTGRIFYWGSAGGSSLYFMTSGYEGEYGSWMPPHRVAEGAQNYFAAMERHYRLFDQWKGLTEVQRDDRLKEAAINHLRKDPLIYVKNVFYNACRVFLNFPYSFEYQKPTTLFYILPNIFLVVGGVISVGLSVRCGVRLPTWLIWVGMLGTIYLGGTLLLSAYPRMLFPLVPILVLWEAYVLSRCVSVRLPEKRSMHLLKIATPAADNAQSAALHEA